ncbi:MAG TPA: TlpA disulfide reductase family protein, partial [Jatrophihabitans sp.]|nr:TlpA disulfide reductase family protein [Jatrophihabitans sp.]
MTVERRPRTLLATTVLALGVLLAGCTGGHDAVDQNAGGQYRYNGGDPKGSLIPVAKRKAAGPVAGSLVGGGEYKLSQDRGKVVVLSFFASWCPPCQTETP